MKRKKTNRKRKTMLRCSVYCTGATGALIVWTATEGVELNTLSLIDGICAMIIGTALMMISYFVYKYMINRQAKSRTHGNAYSF